MIIMIIWKLGILPLRTVYNQQEICFEFIRPLRIKELNTLENQVNLIQKKKQQIKFLSKDIHYKRIEENLLNKDVQIRIEKTKNQIEKDLCFFCS